MFDVKGCDCGNDDSAVFSKLCLGEMRTLLDKGMVRVVFITANSEHYCDLQHKIFEDYDTYQYVGFVDVGESFEDKKFLVYEFYKYDITKTDLMIFKYYAAIGWILDIATYIAKVN